VLEFCKPCRELGYRRCIAFDAYTALSLLEESPIWKPVQWGLRMVEEFFESGGRWYGLWPPVPHAAITQLPLDRAAEWSPAGWAWMSIDMLKCPLKWHGGNLLATWMLQWDRLVAQSYHQLVCWNCFIVLTIVIIIVIVGLYLLAGIPDIPFATMSEEVHVFSFFWFGGDCFLWGAATTWRTSLPYLLNSHLWTNEANRWSALICSVLIWDGSLLLAHLNAATILKELPCCSMNYNTCNQ